MSRVAYDGAELSSAATGVFDLRCIPCDETPSPDATGVVGPRRRKPRRPEPGPLVLNIVSMIDVIFLLMTYFLLTAQFTTREESFEVRVPERLEGASVDTPPADPFALPVTPVVLTVTSRGNGAEDFVIFTDAASLGATGGGEGGAAQGAVFRSYGALTAAAESARGRVLGDDQRFIIRPAADAKWEHALGALNALKRAGFNNVRFANPARAGQVTH